MLWVPEFGFLQVFYFHLLISLLSNVYVSLLVLASSAMSNTFSSIVIYSSISLGLLRFLLMHSHGREHSITA
jgi:hypothetical protein